VGVVAVDGLCNDHFMFIGGVFGKPTEFFNLCICLENQVRERHLHLFHVASGFISCWSFLAKFDCLQWVVL